MTANRKIIFIIFSMVALLTTFIVMIVAYSYRESGFKGAEKRAYLTAEIVKNALTAHMVNNTMGDRYLFLDGMKQLQNVQDIWVVRGENVNKQYGHSGAKEDPRDEIDKEVLEQGKSRTHVKESIENAVLRITIPYVASSLSEPNCMQCHETNEGDVLGAISLRFDISEDRMSGAWTLIKVMGTSAIFLVLILLVISRLIRPYTTIFDTITDILRRVYNGDYTARMEENGVFQEDKEAIKWVNGTIGKLEDVLSGIETNLTSFVHNRNTRLSNDKLLTAQEIIQDLAEIYNFKKTIETDRSKEDIYYRLAQVFEEKLGLKRLVIFENDLVRGTRRIVLQTEGCQTACCHVDANVAERCRAQRSALVVQSDHFPHVCREADCDFHYLCIPAPVSAQKSLTITFVAHDAAELEQIKGQIGIVKKHLEEAKPILETQMLMEILKERNLVDGLTGLYNRKYLDDFVSEEIPATLKAGGSYAVMMLDVDYFKMVNDTYGHDAGDAVLKKLSDTMRANIRPERDALVRFGGEEFLILLRDRTAEEAQNVAEQIKKEFGAIAFTYNGDTFSKTVSIGYVLFPEDTDQIWRAFKCADLALYRAKDTGRNKIVRFDASMLKEENGGKY